MATCEEQGLEYVTDVTNFQPSTTLRNAIRHRVEQMDTRVSISLVTDEYSSICIQNLAQPDPPLPPDIADKMKTMEESIDTLQAVNEVVDITAGRQALRTGVKVLSSRLADIENEGCSVSHGRLYYRVYF